MEATKLVKKNLFFLNVCKNFILKHDRGDYQNVLTFDP